MDHIKFNTEYLPKPNGFMNTGVICYFNSLIQCLISCTSMTELVMNDPDIKNRNILTNAYHSTLTKLAGANSEVLSPMLWNCLMKRIRDTGKFGGFGRGQEDSNEGFHVFIESLGSAKIERLFDHRFRVYTKCECGHTTESKDEGFVCDLSHLELTEKIGLNDFLIGNPTKVEDYKCPKCASTESKLQVRKLTMGPEILVILFKKYDGKILISAPNELNFPTPQGALKYKLIAQSEHSGSQNGGHYWARALRTHENEVKAFLLNDTSVNPSKLVATNETYMLFYHVF